MLRNVFVTRVTYLMYALWRECKKAADNYKYQPNKGLDGIGHHWAWKYKRSTTIHRHFGAFT